MFENINEKLRVIATINFICYCIIGVINLFIDPSELTMALLGIESEGIVKFIMLVISLITGYISSAFLHGFAELLEINYRTECETKKCFEKVAQLEKKFDA
jgi:hypothetical protein